MEDETIFEEKKKKKGGMIFLIIIIVMAVLALVYGILNHNELTNKIPSTTNSSSSNSLPKFDGINIKFKDFPLSKSGSNGAYIARLYIKGTIQDAGEHYNQEWILSTIQTLAEDPKNMGILLVIDSPGGTVYEIDETYIALEEYKRTGKSVWAYFQSLAASGGYYIGCAADTIWANRNTLAGSIGVIAGTSIDATEFLANHGIKTRTFTGGKNKNMLNFNSPLTEEQIQIMQSIADDCYDQFTRIVASSRKMSINKVRELADGRLYTAKQAQENGLIDSIGLLYDIEERMANQVAFTNNLSEEEKSRLSFIDYSYERRRSPFSNKLWGMFGMKSPELFADPVTAAALETLAPNIKYPAYLYKN